MRVPENRSVSGGPAVEIPYAIVKSASPRPDALIYLGDGPGASALAGMSDVLGWLQPFIAERDLIVFDPRGTDLASPALDCLPAFATPDLSQARREAEAAAPPALLPLTDADVRAYACGQRLAGQGIDLAQYGAAQQALDLADLMQALGYAEYNVYAAGYGTRVALEAMRVKPAGLRAAVLDSVLPAQARPDERGPALAAYETALTTLTQCGADPTCQAAFPYIRYRFYKVKDALTRSPLTLTVESPSAFTGEDLTRFLIATGATAAYAPYLPLVIDELERGSADTLTGLLNGQIRPRGAPAAPAAQRNLDAVRDFTTRFQQAVQAVGLDDAALRELGRVLRRSPDRGQLAAFVTAHLPQDEASLLLSQLASLSDQDVELAFTELAGGARQPYLEGAYLAAWCQDAMPNQSLERAQDAYRAAGIPGDLASVDLEAARSAWARCALFTAGQSMTVTRTLPVTSDVPALVLQGLMDTSTAAAWSATARRTLSNSLGVDFPLQGRIVIAQPASQITGCPAIIAGAFLDQPDVPPDAACAGLDYQINWVVK
jgi:pimeloyl-ACP methyl ester carboxylesterase